MKSPKCLLSLLLCLLLTACGPKPVEAPPEVSVSEPSAVSEPGPAVSAPDISAPDSSEPESPGLLPLTQEELTAAHQAAHDYYRDTVFENIVLTEVEPREGEISFRVSCTKGGERVDPDRFISLERQEGVWTVINEGY